MFSEFRLAVVLNFNIDFGPEVGVIWSFLAGRSI